MSELLGFAVPGVVVLTMVAVGVSLQMADFARAFRFPGLILCLCGQWLAAPLIAGMLVTVMPLPRPVAVGMLLVALAPIGAISNFYALLAGANVAATVTLTALSSVLTVLTAPMVAWLAFDVFLFERIRIEVPLSEVLRQSFLSLLLPMAGGMLFRHLAPIAAASWAPRLRILSICAVALLVTAILIVQLDALRADVIVFIVTAALAFTALLVASGWLAGTFIADWPIRYGQLFGFPARHVGFATLLAVQTLGNVEFASFAAIFFVVQVVVLVPFAMIVRPRQDRSLAGHAGE